MPRNSTGQIAISQDVSAISKFTLSPELAGVRLSKIPSGSPGISVFLPAEPSDDDAYDVADVDGSCGPDSPIVVLPDPGGTATVGRITGFPFIAPFSGGRFSFDAAANDWVVSTTGNGALAPVFTKLIAVTNVIPGDLTGTTTTPTVLFAYQLDGTKGGGLVAFDFNLSFALNQADTITIALFTATAIAVSGGAPFTGTLGTLRVEQSGGGGAVTVTDGTEQQFGQWINQVATGDIQHQTASWSGTVPDTVGTSGNPPGIIARISAATAGTQITGMNLATSVRQIT
jgi:hypothetical protein